MAVTRIDGILLKELFTGGLANIRLNAHIIDELNVFPIPDGDTGSNMQMTLEGANKAVKHEEIPGVGDFMKKYARGALLGARGNSGVILSQFIKGFSVACEGLDELDIPAFTKAFGLGVERAYESVINPTEGTILTVMREGFEHISTRTNITNFHDYFARLIRYMDESLEHTPELLPILKESGVIDSGGAGFVCFFRGIDAVTNGEKLENVGVPEGVKKQFSIADAASFDADSLLEYGYCTEFILQLQNSKVDIDSFKLEQIVEYLESIGDSIVAVKDDDLVKVHVHTFTPGKVLNFGQRFGEYITLKIENMSVQHNESSLIGSSHSKPEVKRIHKPIAVVAVVNGPGFREYFGELGVDVCMDGGRTENPSTADFIRVFDGIDAQDIIVLPCNPNIVMAAAQAAEFYNQARVHIVKAKTPAEGYAALSMMDLAMDVEDVIATMEKSIAGTTTGMVTTAIRDVDYHHISVKEGHFIGMNGEKVLSDSQNRLGAVRDMLLAMDDIKNKEVIVVFYGADVPTEELDDLEELLSSTVSWAEFGFVNGGQEMYDYIFAIE
ncbi:MAG: DAK2 domain-containing protein [Lachnospiraceae bacterium]|jgi:DAK2 domain fusion protein YloV